MKTTPHYQTNNLLLRFIGNKSGAIFTGVIKLVYWKLNVSNENVYAGRAVSFVTKPFRYLSEKYGTYYSIDSWE